jgi:hypothetical protein
MLKLWSVAAALSAAALATVFAVGLGRAPGPEGPAVPVVVELFTSEGCSSCPPADEVLTELVSSQSVPGAEVIALGEHVDYWDSLGWRDPFSSAAFSARQRAYDSAVFKSGQVYTPQMVVNGRYEFIGSSMPAARRAIAAAVVDREDLDVMLNVDRVAPGALTIHVEVGPTADRRAPATAEVMLAVVENGLVTSVERGENRGRVLHHSAVTRLLTSIGTTESRTGWTGDHRLAVDAAWKTDALALVAFVQERSSRRILGAATARIQ